MMPAKTATAPADDLFSGKSRELVDDIKNSLDRIEKLLNCGQQLLYGDGAADGEEASVSPDEDPADVSVVAISALQHFNPSYASYHSSPQRRRGSSCGLGSGGESVAHQQLASRSQYNSENASHRLSGEGSHQHSLKNSSKERSRYGRSRADQRLMGSNRPLLRSKRNEVSPSLRGRQIRSERGRMRNLEEGVDPSDTPQNITIAALKERIRRELEEYRRSGPLMHRIELHQRLQRAVIAKRALSKNGASSPSGAATAVSRPSACVAAASVKSGSHAAPESRQVVKRANTTSTRRTLQNLQEQTPLWEHSYRNTAMQQPKWDHRAQQRHVENGRSVEKSHPPTVASPVPNTYSPHYHPLKMSTGSHSSSRDLPSNQTSGSSYAPRQHMYHVQNHQRDSPSAEGTSKSSMTTSQLTTERPARMAIPQRPSVANSSPDDMEEHSTLSPTWHHLISA
ncbi:conserved hypothetical protein [Leishmania braziliensis MHOM/BR/75/M2904]|uniref:Uncharacterized protein n=2 Tax=Leishmania braziliensis TaxID=5660 RepID=A4H5Q1_LEIBR|nr:conserved hypothetical protein [Leishmania braziliensis MHOM/BR/75/M2904]KAI5690709.1 hypothetical protein MNV84_01136 [Leishmania braziliensis]CAJ2467450.1 unnamed protein product [Leishmania braziliensis]CAJ2468035.1 unnamed protein product [Leishmania braziliensis]CAM41817.1 conserved hypothetical protein [Leishmania braziliensis MHOM/BR/75/M2904]SYZ63290.1 hypothetical_protein [Leishmania braziliensis MHOM/BR/75/M2904]